LNPDQIKNRIWKQDTWHKVVAFAWSTAPGRIIMADKLQKGGIFVHLNAPIASKKEYSSDLLVKCLCASKCWDNLEQTLHKSKGRGNLYDHHDVAMGVKIDLYPLPSFPI
jgi:hypothetical protein